RGAGAAGVPVSVDLVSLAGADLGALASRHRRVVMGAGLLSRFPALARARVPLALDLYDPVPLEAAELYRGAPSAVRRAVMAEARETLALELRRADALLCASERQADLWRGALMLAGGGEVPIIRVPFGVAEDRPEAGPEPVMKGRIAGIGAADRVLLWAGGLHDWLDPELVVKAAGLASRRLPEVRLVFMGSVPPNSALQGHGAAARAREVARREGLLDRVVFFLEGWVPYAERGSYLLEADIGVSAHHDTTEARYSWRTRILDYLWSSLPVVCTGGDPLGDLVGARGAGLVTSPGDAEAMAASIQQLLQSPEARARCQAAARELAAELRWSAVSEPLAAWIAGPDTIPRRVGRRVPVALWWMYGVKAVAALRRHGVGGVRQRLGRFRDRPS
ncbi:MAG TPA: glycosyltransferase, partial [Candidatus Dormibacteraeota bacterium]|nr:glycosyltransferase [Candidatus Dormibacteraeota bacterium]